MDETELDATLAAKEAELREMLGELTRPVEAGATIGFGKRIGDGTIQAIQQMADASSAKQLSSLLDQVTRARAKIADGSYGRCDVCDQAIAPARLAHRPWSIECVAHA